MAQPKELSIAEIRQYMLENGCKVTNHSLVKHFKRFLTHPQTQNEARKQFKTYVNILSTIKNEDNQKYLILRKKYINEAPSAEVVERAVASAANESAPSSPGCASITSDGGLNSPFRQPPPYKPPPDFTPNTTPKAALPTALGIDRPAATTGVSVHQEHVESYRDCVNEFNENYSARHKKSESSESGNVDVGKNAAESNQAKSISRSSSVDETNNKENIPRFSFSSGMSLTSTDSSGAEKASGAENEVPENPISVKEATRKFNRMASEEESRIISPPAKKKPEKELIEEKALPEVSLPQLKIKEWIVSMAKANYQELAKLANEHPELVKIQDPATYTALHWAAKHGNEDVVKLIAGTYKADVNARTNGGYTPLHLATQFGREHIFELLWNVYKANRDLMDWSGNKPLDYSQQRPSVSASTCSKIKARKKHTLEKDLGFLRIGSLNVRVKKTTEAFSNFLGVGNGNGNVLGPMAAGSGVAEVNRLHQRSHRHHRQPRHLHAGTTRNRHHNPRAMTTQFGTMNNNPGSRASVPINSNLHDIVHKSWGSADNIPQSGNEMMPPPKSADLITTKRHKSSKRSSYASNTTNSPRDSIASSTSSSNLNSGYSSMPTTPNQVRAPISINIDRTVQLADSDSDSACGFGSNWSVSDRNSLSRRNNIYLQ